MTIAQNIKLIQTDHYRDRTGDYTPMVEAQIIVPRKSPPVSSLKHISVKDYWKLYDKQNNRCAICGNPPSKHALHLDHCHQSKKVRGLICHGCNIAIGMIKENPSTARAIANYLDHHASM